MAERFKPKPLNEWPDQHMQAATLFVEKTAELPGVKEVRAMSLNDQSLLLFTRVNRRDMAGFKEVAGAEYDVTHEFPDVTLIAVQGDASTPLYRTDLDHYLQQGIKPPVVFERGGRKPKQVEGREWFFNEPETTAGEGKPFDQRPRQPEGDLSHEEYEERFRLGNAEQTVEGNEYVGRFRGLGWVTNDHDEGSFLANMTRDQAREAHDREDYDSEKELDVHALFPKEWFKGEHGENEVEVEYEITVRAKKVGVHERHGSEDEDNYNPEDVEPIDERHITDPDKDLLGHNPVAVEFLREGDAAWSEGRQEEAGKLYGEAITHDPSLLAEALLPDDDTEVRLKPIPARPDEKIWEGYAEVGEEDRALANAGLESDVRRLAAVDRDEEGGIHIATPEEGRQIFKETVQRALGISTEEFLQGFKTGNYDYSHERPNHPAIAEVLMTLPFIGGDLDEEALQMAHKVLDWPEPKIPDRQERVEQVKESFGTAEVTEDYKPFQGSPDVQDKS